MFCRGNKASGSQSGVIAKKINNISITSVAPAHKIMTDRLIFLPTFWLIRGDGLNFTHRDITRCAAAVSRPTITSIIIKIAPADPMSKIWFAL